VAVGIFDRMDASRADRQERIERVGAHEERKATRSWLLADGTIACPACDAPVAPASRPMAPADALTCPVCDHAGPVRDFLSLAQPTRPAHVQVRIVLPPVAPVPA
jgi:hypothetical protein